MRNKRRTCFDEFLESILSKFCILKQRESVDYYICVEVQRSLNSCSFVPSFRLLHSFGANILQEPISDYPIIPRLRRLFGSYMYLDESVICAGGKPEEDVDWEPC